MLNAELNYLLFTGGGLLPGTEPQEEEKTGVSWLHYLQTTYRTAPYSLAESNAGCDPPR